MKRHIRHCVVRSAGIVIFLIAIAGSVQAQYVVGAKAGIIQFAAGDVFWDNKPVRLSKGDYLQMENGQTLRTERGFAELLLGANVYLRLGMNGLLRLYQNQLSDTQLALERGSALVEVVDKAKGSQIRIVFAGGLVEITKKGLYRFDAGPRELRVYGGEAAVARRDRKAKIKSGRMIRLDNDFKPSKFDANAADSLHQWAAFRSFILFADNPVARTQMHWTPISMGWVKNFDYRISFRSADLFAEWMQWRNSRLSTDAMLTEAAERARRTAEAQAAQQANAARLEQARKAAQETQGIP